MPLFALHLGHNYLVIKNVERKTKSVGIEVEISFVGGVVMRLVVLPVGQSVRRCRDAVPGIADVVIRRRIRPQVATRGLGRVADITGLAPPSSVRLGIIPNNRVDTRSVGRRRAGSSIANLGLCDGQGRKGESDRW